MRNNFWFTFIYAKITKLLQITGSLTVSSVDAFRIFMKTILLKQASAESRHQK